MADVIDDVMGGVIENDTNCNEGNLDTDGRGVDVGFQKLLEEVQFKLYHGCSFSSLNFLAKLMHIKVINKWTDSSFDQLLELLQTAFPEGNRVPPSHYEAKKTLKKIGLGYEPIHVCKNDCFLFRKEHELLQKCPVCNESRWVDENTKGKKVAHKVLRYFPVTPRLQRLYCSRHTAKYMIWHCTRQSKDGTMIHPIDGTSWKKIDMKYPEFSREPRNVCLGLAADGFNPFGNMCNPHSTWPVILTTYNLPPWLCMKESSFMLTLLIPDPKAPGKDLDVFLRPLVDELKQLWSFGVRTKDAATNTFFNMKAMLLWTINDFPARSSLSDADHPWRKSLDYNGKHETRGPPRKFSEEEIQAQHARLLFRSPGKVAVQRAGIKRDREDFELNWSKKSIFFELEYWSSLELKHNFDLMHVEKNVGESLVGTSLTNDKSKDTSNAWADLTKLNIRKNLWLKKNGNKFHKPHPPYSFTKPDRIRFCKFIRNVKLPDGFRSNIGKKVNETNTNIIGLKSHDYHILRQRLLPIGVKGLLGKGVYTPIIELCMFFKQLCSRTLSVKDMKEAKPAIIKILCKLVVIYPPAFFNIMVHLVLHLPDEAISGGPVCMRWMYPFERYMKKLKNYVRNKARPEGSIAEGYVAEEALSFCPMYLEDVETRSNRLERNEDVIIEETKLWVFQSKCRPTSGRKMKNLSPEERKRLHCFVLDNCEEVRKYIAEFKSLHPESDEKIEFPKWFLHKVYDMQKQKSPEFNKELSALSIGVHAHAFTYTACIVNGVRYMVLMRDAQRSTQNSGVLTEGEHKQKYYGQLEEIIELHYPHKYSTVLFRCKWFDTAGVKSDNNFTSIDPQRELSSKDQLIFATQAKQWVVENVNHRRIWDLPMNDVDHDPIENVDNDSTDVVLSNASSNFTLSIDFSQYFQNSQPVEDDIEVDPPASIINNVCDCKTDYDEEESNYDSDVSADTEVSEGEND
ncbi:uncharacterized protein LOC128129137 [Lactuca sativa]|uniref:uncharacterized protein LOC128129137 n=1 Tax=Lactuca sativa TaxID=4236 RepID=UPI0022AE5C8C|nr:uncharacterized protein LOC128129137 [Lactuca sativa]